ncbi:hypothetical protein ACPEIC_26500 [Stenotrophomonas sp. NPDC087984]
MKFPYLNRKMISERATLAMLANQPAWRIRAVERVELSSALWSEREREIHVVPLEAASREITDLRWALRLQKHSKSDETTLILPITDLPTVPIIDLHITVADNAAYRLPLKESARIQAAHIRNLAKRAGVNFDPKLTDLLASIFCFQSSAYGDLWKKYNESLRSLINLPKRVARRGDPVYEYLESKSGRNGCIPFSINKDTYRYWQGVAQPIGSLVEEFSLRDHLSATGNPLIGLPNYFEMLSGKNNPRARLEEQDVTELLITLRNFLDAAKEIADNQRDYTKYQAEAARNLLSSYSAYGLLWTAFARCTVPTDKPFTITVREKRPVYFTAHRDGGIRSRTRNRAYKMVSFGDAKTNHLSIHAEDNSVRLGSRCKSKDQKLAPLSAPPDEEQMTSELYLRHDSTQAREGRIFIEVPLKLTRLTAYWLWLTIIVAAYGIFLLISRGLIEHGSKRGGYGLTSGDAAIFLIPVAFAASFLLTKDTSTLNARLRRKRQAILLVEIAILLVMAFVFFSMHYIKVP